METNHKVGTVYMLKSDTSRHVFIGCTTKKLIDCLCRHLHNYKLYKKGQYEYVNPFEILEHTNFCIRPLQVFYNITRQELKQKKAEYAEYMAAGYVVRRLVAKRFKRKLM